MLGRYGAAQDSLKYVFISNIYIILFNQTNLFQLIILNTKVFYKEKIEQFV